MACIRTPHLRLVPFIVYRAKTPALLYRIEPRRIAPSYLRAPVDAGRFHSKTSCCSKFQLEDRATILVPFEGRKQDVHQIDNTCQTVVIA